MAKYAFVVSAENPHPQVTLRWADYHYERDISIQANYGMYDSVLRINENGLREQLEPIEWGGLTQGEFRSKYSPINGEPFVILFEYWGTTAEMWEEPAGRVRILEEVYSKYIPEELYPQLTFTLDEAIELERSRQTIVDFIDQQATKWVRCSLFCRFQIYSFVRNPDRLQELQPVPGNMEEPVQQFRQYHGLFQPLPIQERSV